MRTTWLYRVIAIIIIGVLFLTSCNIATTSPPNTPENTENIKAPTENNPEPLPTEGESATNPPASTEEGEAVPATPDAPTPTPIVETRLPPERWQEWPVVPVLTGREAAIYQLGQELGNDPTHFSKVGDCQAIKEVLMGIYDQPDRYVLTENQAYLQETIDQFAGSFNRDGQGVRGGFNAAAVLSPLWADPEACQPGESPIECEYRIHKPSFVIISLEVWWEGRTVERYEEYMRQIIDFYIANGVVPILSTKADNVEGDHRINLATARLAYEYHLPLWNFWLAVQPLPNRGIDPDRDGFHISYEAWSVRSFTALQALDAVWRGVRDQTASNGETPEAAETPTVNFPPVSFSPNPSAAPAPVAGNQFVFSITQRSGESTQSAGVFLYVSDSGTLYQLFEAGTHLEDIDPTGSKLLISQGNQLLISNLNAETQLVTDELAISMRNASAFWMPDGSRLVVLTENDEGKTLWLVDPATDQWEAIAKGNITGIIEPRNDTDFYWYQGQCTIENGCEDNAVWRWQAGTVEQLAESSSIAMSPDAARYVWTETTEENMIILYSRNTNQTEQNFVYLPGNRLVDLNWEPIYSRVAVLTVNRSDYSGKSSDARIFVVDTNAMTHLEYFAFPGLNPKVHWRNDGSELMLVSTLPYDEGYQLHFRQMNLASGLFENLDDALSITSTGFITFEKFFWVFPE